MTTDALPAHLERHALTAVFLLAILAIVGLVSLVAHGPAVSGVHIVSAESRGATSVDGLNVVGDVRGRPTSCPGGGTPPCR